MTNEWLDVHAHFAPPASEHAVRAVWQAMREEHFMMPEPYVWQPAAALAHMDATGVAMQLLSQVPRVHGASTPTEVHNRISESNHYGASLAATYPDRFGLLAALPTDDVHAALSELDRATQLGADGFLCEAPYAGVHLGDERLEPLWAELDRRRAVVFIHPDAHAPSAQGRPSPLLEVAFDTARTVVDMLYAGVFRRYQNLTVILAHAGGALPAVAGRLRLLGTEPWVPNPNGITSEEIDQAMCRLYVDVAASGDASLIAPAAGMVGLTHLVYGSDSGTPCTTHDNVSANLRNLFHSASLSKNEIDQVGRAAFDLFPAAAKRAGVTIAA
jgi:predicted TIM-barrel fold metal-dependent hydrolase